MAVRKHSPMRREDVRIAAVIPLYNGAPFIRQALESVLNQSLPPAAIIVVDDGSTDTGPDIVEELAHTQPITLVRKSNGGQGSARNFGIASTDCNLIALLDQDDLWYSHHLERLLPPFLEPRGNALGWSYSNLDEIDEHGRLIMRAVLRSFPRAPHPKRDLFDCLDSDMYILPSASLIARHAFDAAGGFDERLRGYEDDDLFLRLFLRGYDHVFIDESLSQWRIFQHSTSYSPAMAASRMVYLRKLIEEFPDEPTRGRFWSRDILLPRFLPHLLAQYANALRDGDRALARESYDNLRFIARYPRRRTRLALQVLLRYPRLTRFLFRARPALRPLVRRLLA